VKPLVLLFDLDGTLTDPKPGIVRCMKHALDKLGAPCPPDDILASFIGPSLQETFATLLDTSDQGVVERALALYREEYGDTGLFENRVYAPASPRCWTPRAGSRRPRSSRP
jgi:phosphoglycolate phosphatase